MAGSLTTGDPTIMSDLNRAPEHLRRFHPPSLLSTDSSRSAQEQPASRKDASTAGRVNRTPEHLRQFHPSSLSYPAKTAPVCRAEAAINLPERYTFSCSNEKDSRCNDSLRSKLRAILLKDWPPLPSSPSTKTPSPPQPTRVRVKDSDDYITARAANPLTGRVSPSILSDIPPRTPHSPGEAVRVGLAGELERAPPLTSRPHPPRRRAHGATPRDLDATETGTVRERTSAPSVGSSRRAPSSPSSSETGSAAKGASGRRSQNLQATVQDDSDHLSVRIDSAGESQLFPGPGYTFEQSEKIQYLVQKVRGQMGEYQAQPRRKHRRPVNDASLYTSSGEEQEQEERQKDDSRPPGRQAASETSLRTFLGPSYRRQRREPTAAAALSTQTPAIPPSTFPRTDPAAAPVPTPWSYLPSPSTPPTYVPVHMSGALPLGWQGDQAQSPDIPPPALGSTAWKKPSTKPNPTLAKRESNSTAHRTEAQTVRFSAEETRQREPDSTPAPAPAPAPAVTLHNHQYLPSAVTIPHGPWCQPGQCLCQKPKASPPCGPLCGPGQCYCSEETASISAPSCGPASWYPVEMQELGCGPSCRPGFCRCREPAVCDPPCRPDQCACKESCEIQRPCGPFCKPGKCCCGFTTVREERRGGPFCGPAKCWCGKAETMCCYPISKCEYCKRKEEVRKKKEEEEEKKKRPKCGTMCRLFGCVCNFKGRPAPVEPRKEESSDDAEKCKHGCKCKHTSMKDEREKSAGNDDGEKHPTAHPRFVLPEKAPKPPKGHISVLCPGKPRGAEDKSKNEKNTCSQREEEKRAPRPCRLCVKVCPRAPICKSLVCHNAHQPRPAEKRNGAEKAKAITIPQFISHFLAAMDDLFSKDAKPEKKIMAMGGVLVFLLQLVLIFFAILFVVRLGEAVGQFVQYLMWPFVGVAGAAAPARHPVAVEQEDPGYRLFASRWREVDSRARMRMPAWYDY